MTMYTSRYTTAVYQSQNFDQIKASCLSRRSLFEDPEFQANYRSIFGDEGPTGRLSKWNGNISWKRPVELVQRPHFIADGVSRFDVIQGELGNCWFIAAVANLTLHRDLFVQVVPFQTNAFEPGQYCGAFQFRFWQYGAWTTVVIDDRLPCDRRNELLFLHSSDRREFWSALLEKAYAKLHGSYSALAGGTPSEALQDFSGGIIEMIDFDEGSSASSPSALWPVLKKAYERNSLITCVLAGRRGYHEERTRDGLVRGHAYSVTSVQAVHTSSSSRPHQLIRIRNPWGDHYEWKGAWSDGASEWRTVDSATKARLAYAPGQDGEFWMSMQDFSRQFTRAEVCHLSPDDPGPGSTYGHLNVRPWNKYIVEGAWIRGRSSGGSMNNGSSYAINPQYFFRFVASDADGDGDADKCTVIVSLIQKFPGGARSRANRDLLMPIGFRMFRASGPPQMGCQPERLDWGALKRQSGWSSGAYTDAREVSARFEVETGHYCIVPSTFEAGNEGEFLLRVFSEPEGRPPPGTYGYPSQAPGGVLDSFRNMSISSGGPSPAPPPSYPYVQPVMAPGGCPYPAFPSYGAGAPPPALAPVGPYPMAGPPAAAAPGYPPAAYPAAAYPSPPVATPSYGPPMPYQSPGGCPYPTGSSVQVPGPSPVYGSPYEQQPPLNPTFNASGAAPAPPYPPLTTGAPQPPYPTGPPPMAQYPLYPPTPGGAAPSMAAPYPPVGAPRLPYPTN